MMRPIRIEGDVAYVPLTQGYEAVIDADDVALVIGNSWRAMVKPHSVYAYRVEFPKRRTVLLHRTILNAPSNMQVDHIDGDALNNRRSNLRLATALQNGANKKKPAHNTSGFKGVSWHKRDLYWAANIRVGGKLRHLGRFETAEAAHAAYCKASEEFHGEFGRTA